MRKVAFDSIYLNHLKNNCNIPTVTKVACHEMAGCSMMFVIQLDRPAIGQPWQAPLQTAQSRLRLELSA